MKLIFVCTGNTCRSPMALGIFKSMVQKEGLSGIYCDSAGTFASKGEPAAENAVKVCKEIGVDISEHRSKSINDVSDFGSFDMYIVMNHNQQRALEMLSVGSNKIHVLAGGVPDPFGFGEDVYRQTRDSIMDGIKELLAIIKDRLE